jgi:hypothetical protein
MSIQLPAWRSSLQPFSKIPCKNVLIGCCDEWFYQMPASSFSEALEEVPADLLVLL